jgi:hypothetical protein
VAVADLVGDTEADVDAGVDAGGTGVEIGALVDGAALTDAMADTEGEAAGVVGSSPPDDVQPATPKVIAAKPAMTRAALVNCRSVDRSNTAGSSASTWARR